MHLWLHQAKGFLVFLSKLLQLQLFVSVHLKVLLLSHQQEYRNLEEKGKCLLQKQVRLLACRLHLIDHRLVRSLVHK